MKDMALFDLAGKKALVTGGSIGIGRGFALALAQAGADVAIVARNEIAGNSVVEEIKALGQDSFFVKCDVADQEQVQAMVQQVVSQFGRLDIGVNNAGIAILGADEEIDQNSWDKVIAVNPFFVKFVKGSLLLGALSINMAMQSEYVINRMYKSKAQI